MSMWELVVVSMYTHKRRAGIIMSVLAMATMPSTPKTIMRMSAQVMAITS